MIDQTDIEKLERFSKGLADAEEEKYIFSLFSEKEGDKEFEQYVFKVFNEYFKNNPDEKPDLSYLLERIHRAIQTKKSQRIEKVVGKVYRWYSAIAAVLLIPFLLIGTIWFVKTNQFRSEVKETQVQSTIYAPLGARISFSLPDGTNGWLNSGSSLEYTLPFGDDRQVGIKGEAWFNVAHDIDHPFVVTTGNSKVKVLGTKFNICAYPEENYVEVVLEEGKVEFLVPEQKSRIEMNPNERLIFNDGAVEINTTDASKFSAWKDGKLVFRGDSMNEVARRIERWYNVEIVLVDKELESYIIRGTFQDDSLNEVLHFLSMTSPIRYRIIEQKLLDNGSVQKQKVFLYNKKTN